MRINSAQKTASVSLAFNTVYCVYHIVLGAITASWWFLTIGIYYSVLSVARFVVLCCKKNKHHLVKFTGIILTVLSISLVGTVILTFVNDRSSVLPLIAILTVATYTFTNISLAIINWLKVRRSTSAKIITLRNISLANAFVSIFSLQRSMLVSFEEMTKTEIRIMNMATGSVVCIIVFLIGINLLKQKEIVNEKF